MTDKRLFYIYYDLPSQYQTADGHFEKVSGIGFDLIRFSPNGLTYPIGPMLHNPNSPHNTFSPSCLKVYSGFKRVTTESLSHIDFVDPFKNRFHHSTIKHNRMDYLEVGIMCLSPNSFHNISQLSVRQHKVMSTHDHLRDIHIRLGHVSIDTIIEMCKKGTIRNLPTITKATPIQCHICNKCNLKRIPRGLTDATNPHPFSLLQIDFAFYSKTSIRNNTSILTAIDKGTSYPWVFPTTSKRAPLDLVRFLVNTLLRQGHKVIAIRTDEDGALARNTEFYQMLHDELHLILETTHGYNSTANGKVERNHQTYHNMVSASLYTMQALLPTIFSPT
jgi:hypothetical protein